MSRTAIEHDEAARVWVLHGAHSSYAMVWPSDLSVRAQPTGDVLLHLYWGPPIELADAVRIAAMRSRRWHQRGFESPLDGIEEYPVEGGLRFGRPALSARYPGGQRAIEWRYSGWDASESGGGEELTLRGGAAELDIELHYRVRPDSDVIERWVQVTNSGGEPIELSRIDSAAWTVPGIESHRLSHLSGRWGAETELERVPLAVGETVLTSRRGITSHHANPWFAIDDGTATETAGEVYTGALAWSGSWRLVVQQLPTGVAQVIGGAGHEDFGPYKLAGGETFRTPVFAGLYTSDGFGAASRAWHAYQLRHIMPNADAVRPVLYNSWEATGFDVDEANQRALAPIAARLGCELFVVDDAWFGQRTSDRAGLGDWQVNPDRFPDGLTPLIDRVHELGMAFGIWVEPEMVNPDSDLYRAHPDWVYHFPDRTRHEMRNQLVLNLARPDVADWVYDQLHTLLSANDIQFVKWDMNRPFTEPGWPSNVDNPDRLWIDHVHHLYAVLDRLRDAHPGVAFESCSGGGGRIDMGILARTDQVWTSDNTDALDRLTIQHGYSQVYPARAMSCWVTDVPNFLTHRSVPLKFRFHAAMAGVLGVGGDLTEWSEAALAEAAELIAQYKAIRPVVQHGLQYRLRPPQEGLSAVQYVSADGNESAVLAYLGSQHFGNPTPHLRLAGLAATARYEISGDPLLAEPVSGAVLMAHGVPLRLRGDHDSVVLHLRRS